MNTRILGLAALIGASCFAQTTIPLAPVPADSHEPVNGGIQAATTPTARAAALALLERAQQNSKLHIMGTPAYRLVATFDAAGGGGEVTETWLSGQQWRWTGKFGSASIVRVSNHGRPAADDNVSTVPMPVHMLRNAIFWAAMQTPSNAQFRTATVQMNGKPATCVLLTRMNVAVIVPQSRSWQEEEFCIDNASGALLMHSIAPGTYTVYSHAKNTQFHERPMPDRITIFEAGNVLVDATFGINDAGIVDDALLKPTEEMIAHAPPATMMLAGRITINVPNPTVQVVQPAIVHAQFGADGVTDASVVAAADSSLGPLALEMVKQAQMQGRGRSPQQQMYITVRFVPPSQ